MSDFITTDTITARDESNIYYTMFVNDDSDFNQEVVEPRNYLSKANDCDYVQYLKATFDVNNNKLNIVTDASSKPSVQDNIKYDLFINRTRFNIDQILHIVNNELNINLVFDDDSFLEFPSIRVVLQVGSDSDSHGCTFGTVIDWSFISRAVLVKVDDYYIVEFEDTPENVIFDKLLLDIEWTINDIVLESVDNDPTKLYLPYSRVYEALNDSTDNTYVVNANIVTSGIILTSEPEQLTLKCTFEDSIEKVYNTYDVFYNYIATVSSTIPSRMAIYNAETGDKIIDGNTMSYQEDDIIEKIVILCVSDENTTSFPLNLSDLDYSMYDRLFMSTMIPDANNAIIPEENVDMYISEVNESTNTLSSALNLYTIPIKIVSGEFVKCDTDGLCEQTIDDSVSKDVILHYSPIGTTPADGIAIDSDLNSNPIIYDECLQEYEIETLGQLIHHKGLYDD